MRNKKPIVGLLVGTAVFFIADLLIEFIFKKIHWTDENKSTTSIMIDTIVKSVMFFFIMLYLTKRAQKKQREKANES